MSASQTRCVGRDQELASIRAQLAAALGGADSACIVTGGTGSGKTTLLHEFVATVRTTHPEVVIAWGNCDQHTGALRPLLPWCRILESLTGVSGVTVPAEALTDSGGVLRTARSAFFELAPDVIELLLPGFNLLLRSAGMVARKTPWARRLAVYSHRQESAPVDADRAQLEDQYVAVIERVLEESPLLLVIDDLHHSDSASLDLLERLVGRIEARGLMLLLASHEPEAESRLPSTLQILPQTLSTETVDLDRSMREHGSELLQAYARAFLPGIGGRFIDQLGRHTGGHPLFVAELVEHLTRQGKLVCDGGVWAESGDIDWTYLPRQVENVLSSQFLDLDEELRQALQVASVEGDQFTVEVIAALLDRSPLAIARLLSRQTLSTLIEPLGSLQVGGIRTTRFRFRHSLAQGHVYSSINDVERVYLHQAVADQYRRLVDKEPELLAPQLAYHYDQAGLSARARKYYRLAAVNAAATCSLLEAAALLERAMALCDADAEDEAEICGELARIYATTGRADEAAGLFERAVAQAQRRGSDKLTNILVCQAYALTRLHRFEAAFEAADRALDLARRSDDRLERCTALEALASVSAKRGDHDASRRYLDEALALCRTLDHDDRLASLLHQQGWCLKELGRYEEALQALQESCDIQSRGVPNWSRLAATHNALADLNISTERYGEARAHLEQAVAAWRRFDRIADLAVGLNNLANLANREGLFSDALKYAGESYAVDLEALGPEHPELAFSLTCMGESQLGLKDFAAAIDVLARADQLRTANEVPQGNRAWTRWLLGRALTESERDCDRGMQYVAEARAVFQSMGSAAQSEARDIETWLSARSSQTHSSGAAQSQN